MLENYHRLTATISDLIMGNSYSFRVFSQNHVGTSEASAVTKEEATIQKTGDLFVNYLSHQLYICSYSEKFRSRQGFGVSGYFMSNKVL